MKIKTTRAPHPDKRIKIISLKLSIEEWKIIDGKAKKLSDGNVSAFIRHAAINF